MKNNRMLRFINPRVQKWFLFVNLSSVVITFFVCISAITLTFWKMKKQIIQSGVSVDSPLLTFVDIQLNNIFITLIATVIVVLIASLYFSFILSHRIVGPIYKIETEIKNTLANNGEFQDIKIRKNDFFQELPILINNLYKSKK